MGIWNIIITTKYYTIIEKFVPEQLTAYGRPPHPLWHNLWHWNEQTPWSESSCREWIYFVSHRHMV